MDTFTSNHEALNESLRKTPSTKVDIISTVFFAIRQFRSDAHADHPVDDGVFGRHRHLLDGDPPDEPDAGAGGAAGTGHARRLRVDVAVQRRARPAPRPRHQTHPALPPKGKRNLNLPLVGFALAGNFSGGLRFLKAEPGTLAGRAALNGFF